MHPVSRIRSESYVALIRFKELTSGFRVISAEAALIVNLPVDTRKCIRDNILYSQTKYPGKISCMAMHEVESFDLSVRITRLTGYGLGSYTNLAAIQDKALVDNGRRVEIIQMLNKEH
jgi:hypothetical protein